MSLIIGVVFLAIAAAPPQAQQLAQAGELWARCAEKDPDACYMLGSLRTVRIADPEERARATKDLERDCAAESAAACFALGMYLDDDGGLPIDGERAFGLFEAACDADFPPACQRASIFYRVSVPSFQPGAKEIASALLKKACDAGLPDACVDLAEAGRVGGAVPVDEATASKLFERACALGSFRGCVAIAERILPEPDFACDQCEPNAVERGDARCIECELAQCRREHCCPTCEGRKTYACCCEEFDAPLPYPLTTAVVSEEITARRHKEARRVLSPAVERLAALCGGGFVHACRDLSWLCSNARLPFEATSEPCAGATHP